MIRQSKLPVLGFEEFISVHFQCERIVVYNNIILPGRKPVTLSKVLEKQPYTDQHLSQLKQRYPDAQISEPRRYLI